MVTIRFLKRTTITGCGCDRRAPPSTCAAAAGKGSASAHELDLFCGGRLVPFLETCHRQEQDRRSPDAARVCLPQRGTPQSASPKMSTSGRHLGPKRTPAPPPGESAPGRVLVCPVDLARGACRKAKTHSHCRR